MVILLSIITAGISGGLHCPHKGLLLAATVVALNILPIVNFFQLTLKRLFLFVLVYRLTRKRVNIFPDRYLI